jgi:hypothetical protein
LIMMFYWGEEISRVNFSGGWYKKWDRESACIICENFKVKIWLNFSLPRDNF